jgi:hypothetical protein
MSRQLTATISLLQRLLCELPRRYGRLWDALDFPALDLALENLVRCNRQLAREWQKDLTTDPAGHRCPYALEPDSAKAKRKK